MPHGSILFGAHARAALFLIENSQAMADGWPDLRDRCLQPLVDECVTSSPAVMITVLPCIPAPGQDALVLGPQRALHDLKLTAYPHTRLSPRVIAHAADHLARTTSGAGTRHLIIVAASAPIDDDGPVLPDGPWPRLAQTLLQSHIHCHMVLTAPASALAGLFRITLRLHHDIATTPWFPFDTRYRILLAAPPAAGSSASPAVPRTSSDVSASISAPIPASPGAADDAEPAALSLVSQLQQVHGLTKKKVYGAKPARAPFFREERVRETPRRPPALSAFPPPPEFVVPSDFSSPVGYSPPANFSPPADFSPSMEYSLSVDAPAPRRERTRRTGPLAARRPPLGRRSSRLSSPRTPPLSFGEFDLAPDRFSASPASPSTPSDENYFDHGALWAHGYAPPAPTAPPLPPASSLTLASAPPLPPAFDSLPFLVPSQGVVAPAAPSPGDAGDVPFIFPAEYATDPPLQYGPEMATYAHYPPAGPLRTPVPPLSVPPLPPAAVPAFLPAAVYVDRAFAQPPPQFYAPDSIQYAPTGAGAGVSHAEPPLQYTALPAGSSSLTGWAG